MALNEKIAPKTKTDPKPADAQKPYKSPRNGRHANAPARCSESNRANTSRPNQTTTNHRRRTDHNRTTQKRTRKSDAHAQDPNRTSGHLESCTRGQEMENTRPHEGTRSHTHAHAHAQKNTHKHELEVMPHSDQGHSTPAEEITNPPTPRPSQRDTNHLYESTDTPTSNTNENHGAERTKGRRKSGGGQPLKNKDNAPGESRRRRRSPASRDAPRTRNRETSATSDSPR